MAAICLPLALHADEGAYGVNLVYNGTFDNDTSGWTGSCTRDYELRFEIGKEDNSNIGSYLHLGSQPNTFTQVIDLTQAFTAEELDASPVAFMSCDVMHNYGYKMLKVYFEFLDADGTTLEADSLANLSNPYYPQLYYKDWYSLQGEFTVPVGARKVVVTLSGRDGPMMGGYHGPGFDNVKLEIERPGTVRAKHTITATSNRPDKEKMFGSGEFWEGSTVFIGAQHDMPSYMGSQGFSDHGCGLQFDGYEDDRSFDTSRAMRDITVGTADATYTALFKIKNPSSLSQTSYRIEKAKPETFTEPTLNKPDDYTGSVTWITDDPTVATIDSETGKVTYVGDTSDGVSSVTITAILPADDNYTGTRLSYTINYHGKSAYFGQNVVENGDFSNGKDGWTQTEKNDSIATDNLTPGIGKYLHAGYSSVSYQCVDLSPMFLDSELDAEPRAYISFDYNCSRYMNEQNVKVTYLTAVPSGIVHSTTLATTTHLNKYCGKSGNEEPAPWQTYQDVDTIPAGTRAVKIEIWGKGYGSGQDGVDGPGFDNISFVVRPADEEVKTTAITVTTNKDSETAYGSGTYWQGSTVLIGTGHALYGHSCENNFSGYDGEDEPEKLTTQRAITVPAEVTTHTASFKEPLTASFSQTYYNLDVENLKTFTEPTLIKPDDYKGTITYSSSRPYLAEVDETTGRVTYVGEGLVSREPVYITASLAADDKYAATSCHYAICYGQVLGAELVTNGDFDFKAWGWTEEQSSFMSLTDDDTEGIGKFFHAGAAAGTTLSQTISLTDKGIPESTLDNEPKSYFSIDQRTRSAKTAEKITMQYLDAGGTVLKECTYVDEKYDFCLVIPRPWQTIQKVETVPTGTRAVKILLSGQGYATGSEMDKVQGPDFDNVSLKLRAATTQVKTHDLTVSTNLSDTLEVPYGSGSYWEGSTVYIGTIHDGAPHTCKHFFTGYKGESAPQLTTTQRAVTIGKNDMSYVALFAAPTLSETAVGVKIKETGTLKEPTIVGLPSYYTGKPTYASDDKDLATVNATTGRVTYTGNGDDGPCTISAILPPEGHYAGDTLTYDIFYVKNIVTINSKDDWNDFCSDYKNKYVYARLGADIDLGIKDYIDKFKGIFDGQGHTLNVTLTTKGTTHVYNYGPFYFIKSRAVLRNINIKANIYVNDTNNDMGCLITLVDEGTVTIENCHSHADIHLDRLDDASWVLKQSHNYIGGFIAKIKTECLVEFKDCTFDGNLVVRNSQSTSTTSTNSIIAGFVGDYPGSTWKSDDRSTIKFINCLSYLKPDIDEESKEKFVPFSYDVPETDYTDVTMENCYSLDVAPNTMFRRNEYVVTKAQLASGEIAFRLNAGRTGSDAVWRQTIGTDTIPMHATFSPRSMEVYHKGADAATVGTAGWGTLFYPAATTLPSGAKAYTVNKVEGDNLVLKEVEGDVPAHTPVIICTLSEGESEAEPQTIPLVSNYYNKYVSTGMLKGVYERAAAPNGSYVLQNHDGDVAFYQVDASVAQPYVPAWRCYLDLSAEQQSYSKMNLRIDDETTGISNILVPLLHDGNVYDLEGRRVQSLQKNRIYIKNGRKFIVR